MLAASAMLPLCKHIPSRVLRAGRSAAFLHDLTDADIAANRTDAAHYFDLTVYPEREIG